MLIDTHCHLNFQVFNNMVDEVVKRAKAAGVNQIIIPGTDLPTSKKAVEIASSCHPERSEGSGVYAAVGIHPHHIYQYQTSKIKDQKYKLNIKNDLEEIEKLLKNNKTVAVGEVGLDYHIYQKTKYGNYNIYPELVEGQKKLFIEQIKLANKYKKALIIHNREAKKDVLKILNDYKLLITDYSSVFHCCEPDEELLEFAKNHKMFIGVDGDVIYRIEKQEFIKKVPLEILVLETDSPYLSPFKKFPNEPKNIKVIAEFVAKLLHRSIDSLVKQTTENAKKLFHI